MEISQLKTFVSLAQTQHLTRSAQELNISQSQASKLIASLEAEMGLKLFDRTGRRILLNENGRLFFDYACGALQMMENGRTVLKNARNSPMGSVNIGCYAYSLPLHPCIADFSKKNPRVRFSFSEVMREDVNTLMGITDMVLVSSSTGKEHPEADYDLKQYFPVSRTLLTEEFVAVLSPSLKEFPESQDTITLEELNPFPLVETAPSAFYRSPVNPDPNALGSGFTGHSLHVRYIARDLASKTDLIDRGLGFGFFPECCLETVLNLSEDLRVFKIEPKAMSRHLLIARKHRNQMGEAARRFWDYVIDYHHLEPDR